MTNSPTPKAAEGLPRMNERRCATDIALDDSRTIKNLGWEAWCCECQEPFGDSAMSEYATKSELVATMKKRGWKHTEPVMCPSCHGATPSKEGTP